MTPETMFRCLPLHCTMMAKRCVERQDARERINDTPQFPGCVSCGQGAELRAQLTGYAPDPPRRIARVEPELPEFRLRPCPICGEHVRIARQQFCSRACAGQAKRKHQEEYLTDRLCLECGGPIKLYVNNLGYVDITISNRRRFCSRSCGGMYNARARQIESQAGVEWRGDLVAGSSTPLSPRTPLSP
jgi:hypothetical protein